MNIKYTDRSKLDLYIAFDWYEKQKHGLGHEFLNSIEDSIEKINNNPNLYPKSHLSFHRCIIKRFPFSIYFTIEDEVVVIHSIFDNRLNPNKIPK